MNVIDARAKIHPSHENWANVETQVDLWRLEMNRVESSDQLVVARRSSYLNETHTRTKKQSSQDDGWFGPPLGRGHGAGNSFERKARSSGEQILSTLDNDVTSYWLKEKERMTLFGSKQPRRLFPKASVAESEREDLGWGNPSENTNAYEEGTNEIIREQREREFWQQRDGHWYTLHPKPCPSSSSSSRAKPTVYSHHAHGRRLSASGTQQGYDADRDDSGDDSCDDEEKEKNGGRSYTSPQPRRHSYHHYQQQQQQHHPKRTVLVQKSVQSSSRAPQSTSHINSRTGWKEEVEWMKPSAAWTNSRASSGSANVSSASTGFSLWEPESDATEPGPDEEEAVAVVVVEDLLDFGTSEPDSLPTASRAIPTKNILNDMSGTDKLLDLDDDPTTASALVKESSILESLQGLTFPEEQSLHDFTLPSVLGARISEHDRAIESLQDLDSHERRLVEEPPAISEAGQELTAGLPHELSFQPVSPAVESHQSLDRDTVERDHEFKSLGGLDFQSQRLAASTIPLLPPAIAATSNSGFEFASSNDWIQKLGKKGERQPPREIQVTLTVETKNHGLQPLYVAERSKLLENVKDFCSKFDMQEYEKALFVTLVTMVKNQKTQDEI